LGKRHQKTVMLSWLSWLSHTYPQINKHRLVLSCLSHFKLVIPSTHLKSWDIKGSSHHEGGPINSYLDPLPFLRRCVLKLVTIWRTMPICINMPIWSY
jgi:hypothetical protein